MARIYNKDDEEERSYEWSKPILLLSATGVVAPETPQAAARKVGAESVPIQARCWVADG